MINEPLLLLLFGFSGTGKTFIKTHAEEKFGFESAPKFTTRKSRETAQDKRDFIFCTSEEQMPENTLKFVSYGNVFAIQLDEVTASFRRGKNHVLVVGDKATVKKLKSLFPNRTQTVFVFCDRTILRARILNGLSHARVSRWQAIEEEINNVYDCLEVCDYVINSSHAVDETEVLLNQLFERLTASQIMKEKQI